MHCQKRNEDITSRRQQEGDSPLRSFKNGEKITLVDNEGTVLCYAKVLDDEPAIPDEVRQNAFGDQSDAYADGSYKKLDIQKLARYL